MGSPAMARNRLDFPHPECPTTSSDCPFDTSMLRSCAAAAQSCIVQRHLCVPGTIFSFIGKARRVPLALRIGFMVCAAVALQPPPEQG